MSEGIQKLQRQQLQEVSKTINNLDTTKETNNGICKNAYKHDGTSSQGEQEGKCGTFVSSHNQSSSTKTGLSDLWEPNAGSGTGGGGYNNDVSKTVGQHTSDKISKDISSLTRDQHGVVSSAFAKAHEGAEILSQWC